MNLENVVDNLRNGYSQLEKGSFLGVKDLHEERQSNSALCNNWFYTADGQGYFLREDGGVDWTITQEEENLVLRHINDKVNSSYNQLISGRNFRPDNTEAELAKSAERTVVVDMNKLRLSGEEKEYRFLEIRTADGFVKVGDEYKHPNREEQKAIQRLGYNAKTRKMLRESDNRIAETRIYVLNSEYITEELGNSDDNSLWRASWLYNFNGNSNFGAIDHDVGNRNALRGVRASEASIDTPEGRDVAENTFISHYNAILSNPIEAVKALDDQTVAGLSKIVADYLATKAQ